MERDFDPKADRRTGIGSWLVSLSFDPTQRNSMARELVCADGPAWEVMRAAAVGQILIPALRFETGATSFRAFGAGRIMSRRQKSLGGMRKMPPGVPPNMASSLFGITGCTAYFGITDIGQVKSGDTVVVSGAAGSTGSIAGQIAKIKSCRVIGTAGGKEKCDWLTRVASFDGAIDYRARTLALSFLRCVPTGLMSFLTT